MSKEINHWCVVCGKGYHACDSCEKIKSYTPWRTLTDTIEHFAIFTVLKDYNNKIIDKQEARKLLENSDLSGRDSFKESSKKLLNEILDNNITVESKKIKKKSSVKDESINNVVVINNKEDIAIAESKDNIEE